MVRYSLDPENSTKSCKSRGSNLRVHFKDTFGFTMKINHFRAATFFFFFLGPLHWEQQPPFNENFDLGFVELGKITRELLENLVHRSSYGKRNCSLQDNGEILTVNKHV